MGMEEDGEREEREREGEKKFKEVKGRQKGHTKRQDGLKMKNGHILKQFICFR